MTMSPSPALLSWLGLVSLTVLLPLMESCETGTLKDCAKADFAPGSDLAGEGFDITKMQRKGSFVIDMKIWKQGNKSCTLCKNPYMDGKKQKLPLSVVDWRTSQKCSMRVSSSVYQSSESLVSSTTSAIENNWKVNLDIVEQHGQGSLMLAGSNSKLAEYSMGKTKNDKFSFTTHSASCGYYSYRVSNKPLIHPEFKQALRQLPKEYDPEFKSHFYKLIDSFGTHFITKVTLGGKVHSVTSIRQCQASLQGLSVDEVKKCLDVEASASVTGKVDSNANFKHCEEAKSKTESKSRFSSSFNDRLTEISGGHTTEPELLFSANKDPGAYKEWLSSIPLYPDVISYSLQALHELLPASNPTRKHLRKAVHDYILEKSLWRNCSEPCSSGIKPDPKHPCSCLCRNNPGVTPDCCPTRRGISRIKITVQKASGLWGDDVTSTDAYVKVYDKNKMLIGRTPMIPNNNNPHWDKIFDLGVVILSSYDLLKLEVWDEDNRWDDDLLGTCTIPMKVGVTENFCSLNHGLLYYKTEVECGPSLGGTTCSDYVKSPMNFRLEKEYVSRHSRPIPRNMLQEMGVIPDVAPLTVKQIGYDPNNSVVQLL